MNTAPHVDITPSPRVLRMLGQIDFAPWQCLAELIDNSIDAFIDQMHEGNPPINPKISISLPTDTQLKDGVGVIEISDNGTGMTLEQLSEAVRAGYSGNDPVEKMGLFGMGFNISTARLGRRTEVWTSTKESPDWTGIVIDFDELERKATFEAPIKSKPKSDAELANDDHGTRIKVSLLEADRIRALTKGAGKRKTKIRLGKIYGRIMEDLRIVISYDGDRVVPSKHCTWDKKRSVETARFAKVPAIIPIDAELPSRRFCSTCWVWLSDIEENCPACGHAKNVIDRKRTLRGWVGIQRYFDKEHYGIDLIRNGRVIEELDKTLFYFVDENGEKEIEYPIDATHWGGRIVGELEIDFVRVSHQKDSFDKLDPEWKHVVEIVRGNSPIRPLVAKKMQLPENESPIAKLFAGYRKATPGLKDLVPGTSDGRGLNSGPIQDYVERFYSGESAFQEDTKWFELVQQAEKAKKGGGSKGAEEAAGGFPMDDEADEDDNVGTLEQELPIGEGKPSEDKQDNLATKDTFLSGPYTLDDLPGQPTISVEAYEHEQDVFGKPYAVRPEAYSLKFDYNGYSPFFEESLEKPVDCLLMDLAHHFLAVSQQSPRDYPVSTIERHLREKYFPELSSSLAETEANASALLDSLKRHYADSLPNSAPIELEEIPSEQVAHVIRAAQLAESASKSEVEEKIRSGDFVQHTTNRFLLYLVEKWPILVANGEFFVTPWEIDEDSSSSLAITELIETLSDVLWLKEDGVSAINKDLNWRLRYARSVASLRLLENWRA